MSLSRFGYILLIFIGSWSAYYLYDRDSGFDQQVEPDTELPIFSGSQLQNTSYTDKGLRSYAITSEHLDHYAKSGDTKFTRPVLKVFREGDQLEWQITAETGVLDDNNVLTLTTNVTAKNLLPDSGFDTLSTDSISIQLDNRDFWADTQVTLVGQQFETVGQAMKGNFAENTAVLYNHVQGRYETLTP
ncbi:LPS export ABC transporter periplasmic protein LptC [Vibrio sp.]|uniref:LPS export ABC transporter periplasmic protein LptC n=1 Tax=Vibrio sp. TaxID=678 RepID=UPI003D1268FE